MSLDLKISNHEKLLLFIGSSFSDIRKQKENLNQGIYWSTDAQVAYRIGKSSCRYRE